MRKLLLLIVLFFLPFICSAQKGSISDMDISPDGEIIAFLIRSGSSYDIFLYSIPFDTLIRKTYTADLDLDFDKQYKESLNWIDNDRILFLSKQEGMNQQYILNLIDNTIERVGKSPGNEYYLQYSDENKETYYTSSIKGKEPAVFRRKLDSDNYEKITTKNRIHTQPCISPNGKYLTYVEMPQIKTVLYSLDENRIIDLKIPEKNCRIEEWSPLLNEFIFSHCFRNKENKMHYFLYLYDIVTHSHTSIARDLEYIGNVLWAPCEKKYVYSISPTEVLVADLDNNTSKKYNLPGNPVEWIENCKSILFNAKTKAYIFNLETEQIIPIVNIDQSGDYKH